MSASPDVLIIGGGVIGLTTAYYLASDKVQVAVVDQSDFGREASWAGAGIIPPGSPKNPRTPYDQLRAVSSHLFFRLSEELRQATGVDNGYLCCGGLEYADAAATGGAEEWRSEGVVVEEWNAAQIRQREPAVTRDWNQAYYLPEMAQIRNPRHLKALVAWCRARSVELRSGCPVFGFEKTGERITGVKTAAGILRAERFLIAAGAWSDSLLEQVGVQPGIHPVRGQIALLNASAPLFNRILLHGSRYLVPRPDGRILVGSTEEDAGFDKRTTAEAIRDLLNFAVSVVPELASASVERTWAGLRPGSPDGLPYLGVVPGFKNLFVAAGHFRSGLQLSPATGLVMKEVIVGQEPSVPLEPFRLDRPRPGRLRPAFRS